MIIFVREQEMKDAQGFIIAEKKVLFEVDDFTVVEGLVSLIASYHTFYVNYPKSSIAASFLLFIQEILLNQPDKNVKKTAKFLALVNSII